MGQYTMGDNVSKIPRVRLGIPSFEVLMREVQKAPQTMTVISIVLASSWNINFKKTLLLKILHTLDKVLEIFEV